METILAQAIGLMNQAPLGWAFVVAALWMALEGGGIGVPIEPMMLAVGSIATQGRNPATAQSIINLILGILAMCFGCLLGATVAYIIGQRIGAKAITRYGKYVGLTAERVNHIDFWLRRRGAIGVFLLRLTPMIRTYGSFVEGEAAIPFGVFAVGTLGGEAIYSGAWAILGYVLGANYEVPLRYLQQIGTPGILILIGVVLALVLLHRYWMFLSWRRLAQHFHKYEAEWAAKSTSRVAANASTDGIA
ncbi:MAG: DedA family protein [Ktedonobacterales bacterium]